MFLNNLKNGIEFILSALLEGAYSIDQYALSRSLLEYAIDKTPINIYDQHSYRSLYKMYMDKHNKDIWGVLSDKDIEEEAKKHMVLLYIKSNNNTSIEEIKNMIKEVNGHDDPIFMYDLLTKSSMQLENYIGIFNQEGEYLCKNSFFVSLYALYCRKNKIPKPPYLKTGCSLNIYSILAYNYNLVDIVSNYSLNDNIILYSLYQDEPKRMMILRKIKNNSLLQAYYISRLTNDPTWFLKDKSKLRNYEYAESVPLRKWTTWIVNKNDISESLKKEYIMEVFNYMQGSYGIDTIMRITGYYEEMDDKIKQLPPDDYTKYEIINYIVEKHPEKEFDMVSTLSKRFIIQYLEENGYRHELFDLAKDSEEAQKYIQKNIDKITL